VGWLFQGTDIDIFCPSTSFASGGIANKAATRQGEALWQGTPIRETSKREHSLFSVMGDKHAGPATELIIAATEADAEYCALNELGFVTVSATILPRNCPGEPLMQPWVQWE
jgi:hypothetical protein